MAQRFKFQHGCRGYNLVECMVSGGTILLLTVVAISHIPIRCPGASLGERIWKLGHWASPPNVRFQGRIPVVPIVSQAAAEQDDPVDPGYQRFSDLILVQTPWQWQVTFGLARWRITENTELFGDPFMYDVRMARWPTTFTLEGVAEALSEQTQMGVRLKVDLNPIEDTSLFPAELE